MDKITNNCLNNNNTNNNICTTHFTQCIILHICFHIQVQINISTQCQHCLLSYFVLNSEYKYKQQYPQTHIRPHYPHTVYPASIISTELQSSPKQQAISKNIEICYEKTGYSLSQQVWECGSYWNFLKVMDWKTLHILESSIPALVNKVKRQIRSELLKLLYQKFYSQYLIWLYHTSL